MRLFPPLSLRLPQAQGERKRDCHIFKAAQFASCLIAVLLAAFTVSAQTPAFPGALGFGANATGGRNGTVYHVTTLADSGPGSFRTSVGSPNRIIVFDVGGYISLLSAVSVRENITIAGQTAPGGGIGFKGGEISFASRNNIICRHIRIRPGSDTASNTDDALSLYRAQNVICDHVSLEFGPWNNVGAVSDDWQNYPVTSVTFQNCLNADPTYQQFGAHTESVGSTMAWIFTVFANSHNRNPLSKINDVFINNVLYNCSAGYTTHTSTEFDHDIVNNYFISGPAYGGSSDFPWFQVDNNQSIFYSGNYFDGDRDSTLDSGITTPYWYQGGGTVLSNPWSGITSNFVAYSAATAYRIAVSRAGAFPRDQVDDLVLSQVKTLGNGPTGTGAGTTGPDGSLYTSQTQTGLGNNGYGSINGGIAPIDSDGDGMPDYWEKAVGLNVDADDAMTIGADGYANIERYINWLAEPHAMTVTNTPVAVDLWQYTTGFTNVSPVYSVSALSNGIVTLTNGHIAHFVPPVDFSGLGAVQFSVTASDGTGYTNSVVVLISPVTPPSNLIWQGDGTTNLWANGSGSNWLKGDALVTFSSGDNVTFDDSGSNAPAINLSGALGAGTVYVLAEQDYTFGGSGFLAGGTALFKTGNGTLFLNTANTFSGGTTINDGVVQVGDGASINGSLGGIITNQDRLIFANPTALTSSASVSGSGTFTKNGAGTLTLTGSQTYTNLTTINAGTLEFSGTPPQGSFTNNGTLTFKSPGVSICPGVINGPGSVVVNNSSATIYLTGANSYAGGTTNTSGNLILSNNAAAGTGPVIYAGGSVMVGGGCVITNDFSIPGSTTTDLSMQGTNGTGIWAGNVVNLGSSASWRPGADSGGALMFTGTANQGSRNFIVPRGSVQFASNAVISATGSATAFGRDTSGGNRSANVTIRDNAVVTLGVCNLGGNQAGGNVTLTIQNNAALNCGANSFDVNNVNRTTAQTFIRLNGGTFTVGGFTKTKTAQTNVIQFNGGVLKAGAATAAFLPAFSVSSNYVQAGGAKIDDGGFTINAIAAPLLHDPSLGSTLDGGLTKLGSGKLTLAANNTYTGPTWITAGTLTLYAPPIGSISNSASIYIAAGAQLDFSLGGTAAMTLGAGKTIWGNGSVAGAFTLGNAARLAPGSNAIGSLTFSNSLTLAAGCSNLFEISHSPLANDFVKVLGALTNGGAIIISNSSGGIAAGDVFKLFDAASYAGSFSTVILPTLAPGLAWNTSQLDSAGTISVISTLPPPPPVFRQFDISGNYLVLGGSNGPVNGTYYVLTSTNISLPISNWSVLATNQFDATGNFIFSNAISPGPPQFFCRLLLP